MKVIGFILVALGILLGACSKIIPLQNFAVKIGFSSIVLSAWGIYIAGGLVVIGLLVLILVKDSNGAKEVPIYQGDRVVGYRRH